jgi:hypothetical protein
LKERPWKQKLEDVVAITGSASIFCKRLPRLKAASYFLTSTWEQTLNIDFGVLMGMNG